MGVSGLLHVLATTPWERMLVPIEHAAGGGGQSWSGHFGEYKPLASTEI